jgi:hypothetical protein
MSSQNGGPLPMSSPLVKAELDRLASVVAPAMPDSLSGLLEYLIRRACDGVITDDRMIARDVFRRGDDFDTETDPIVRIQINRLRRRLEAHYEEVPSPIGLLIDKGASSLSARVSDVSPSK